MALLNDIYMLCAVGGFLYLVGTAALGFMHMNHGGDAGDGGDAGSADAGDAGGIDADSGDAGSVDAGGDAGDTGSMDGGADAGGDAGGIDAGDLRHAQRTNLAHARAATTTPARFGPRINVGLLLLKIASPYTVACFAFFFGLTGLVLNKYAPFIPTPLVLLSATISGIMGYNLLTTVMNAVADKLYASSNFKEEDLIGSVGELTIPITRGSTGEIIYLVGKTRNTAPARAKDPSMSLARDARVMIADIVDGVFIVEPYTDLLLDDSLTIEPQKLRNN